MLKISTIQDSPETLSIEYNGVTRVVAAVFTASQWNDYVVVESLITGKEEYRALITETIVDGVALRNANDIKTLNKVIAMGFKGASSSSTPSPEPIGKSYVQQRSFNGFTLNADLSEELPTGAGLVVYVEHQARFAYAVPTTTGYTWYKHWSEESLYQDESGVILPNVMFTCAGNNYHSSGGILVAYVNSKKVRTVEPMTLSQYEGLTEVDDNTFYIILEDDTLGR